MSKEERKKRAQKYINLVGLQGFENSYPVQLSGGMKQRVGIARAYCNEPELLLMDEPFGALDAQTRYLMQEELQRIWSAEKRTVIFVTNNIEEALYLADRIIVLTNCPATVKKEYVIDLPRPRNLVSEKFLALRKEITGILDNSQGKLRIGGLEMSDQIKVQVRHLTKKFGDLLVLDDVSFDVMDGDLLCVVGPTGCGKNDLSEQPGQYL